MPVGASESVGPKGLGQVGDTPEAHQDRIALVVNAKMFSTHHVRLDEHKSFVLESDWVYALSESREPFAPLPRFQVSSE